MTALIDPALSLTLDEQEKLLAKWQAAKDRCEVNAQLAAWIIDLTARLKRAEINFVYRDCSVRHDDFAIEIERLRLCIQLARNCRPEEHPHA